jgi:hypothetical protein
MSLLNHLMYFSNRVWVVYGLKTLATIQQHYNPYNITQWTLPSNCKGFEGFKKHLHMPSWTICNNHEQNHPRSLQTVLACFKCSISTLRKLTPKHNQILIESLIVFANNLAIIKCEWGNYLPLPPLIIIKNL